MKIDVSILISGNSSKLHLLISTSLAVGCKEIKSDKTFWFSGFCRFIPDNTILWPFLYIYEDISLLLLFFVGFFANSLMIFL